MEPTVDIAIKSAQAYAARHQLQMVERLGFGIHGSVHVVEDNLNQIWAEWEAEKQEQFGTRWRTVQAVMDSFEALGVHLVDVSPSNIAFLH